MSATIRKPDISLGDDPKRDPIRFSKPFAGKASYKYSLEQLRHNGSHQ